MPDPSKWNVSVAPLGLKWPPYRTKGPMADAKRQQRKIDNQREIEARWLQKMLFALSKAREAREKLAEATGEALNPLITLDDGTQIPLDTLEAVVDKRVEHLMDALGQGVYGKR